MSAILSPICCEIVIEILKYNRINNFDICVSHHTFSNIVRILIVVILFFFQNFFPVPKIQIDKRSFDRKVWKIFNGGLTDKDCHVRVT